MASTYNDLKIQLMTTGENLSTWGNVTNVNLGTAITEAIAGSADVTFASGTVTLTLTNTNASQTARNLRLNLTGTSGGAQNLIVPAIEKVYIVNNGCADAITVKNSSGTGIAVPAGKTMWVYNNGTDVGTQLNWLGSLTLGTALPIASGGTGSTSTTFVNLATNVTGTLPVANGGSGGTTAATARTNFGATTLGGNLFTITNPSAVTFPRFNADNTVSSLNAADFRTAIGAGSGGGSVTSVAGTGTANGLTLSGTVTSSGNITLSGSVTSLTTTNFTIMEESGKLVIKYQGTVVASFSSAGALIAKDNVTAYGTP